MNGRRRRAALAGMGGALVLLAVAGCGASAPVPIASCAGAAPSGSCASAPPSVPPGALSREAAITAARRAAPIEGGQPTVVWATIQRDPFSPPEPDARVVWVVRLEGSFAASPCPSGFDERLPIASDPPCLDDASGLDVVLDAFTGSFIGWVH